MGELIDKNQNIMGRALRIAIVIAALVVMAEGAGAATPISSCTNITSPGEYVLTQSIINSSVSTCINITSNNVVFDGAGYTIDGIDTTDTYGVYVHSSTTFSLGIPPLANVIVKNLRVTDWYRGIHYHNTANGSIANNEASSNMYGLFIDFYSRNNTLTNNNASLNSYGGITIGSPFSGSNFITNNTINSNGDYGISLKNSNNTLTNNTINSNGDYGIYLFSFSNNSVYNNHFNNTNNFYFSGTNSNVWNTTKASGKNIVGGFYLGGNIWANPNGTGFSQTCADANSDGICDSAYALATDNIDYLPLTYLHSSTQPTPIPTPRVTPLQTPTTTVTPNPTTPPSTGGDVVSTHIPYPKYI